MFSSLVTLGVMWGVGWAKKHKTNIDHKKWGPLSNVVLGVGGAFIANGDVSLAAVVPALKEGLVLAGAAELGLSGTKAGLRSMKR